MAELLEVLDQYDDIYLDMKRFPIPLTPLPEGVMRPTEFRDADKALRKEREAADKQVVCYERTHKLMVDRQNYFGELYRANRSDPALRGQFEKLGRMRIRLRISWDEARMELLNVEFKQQQLALRRAPLAAWVRENNRRSHESKQARENLLYYQLRRTEINAYRSKYMPNILRRLNEMKLKEKNVHESKPVLGLDKPENPATLDNPASSDDPGKPEKTATILNPDTQDNPAATTQNSAIPENSAILDNPAPSDSSEATKKPNTQENPAATTENLDTPENLVIFDNPTSSDDPGKTATPKKPASPEKLIGITSVHASQNEREMDGKPNAHSDFLDSESFTHEMHSLHQRAPKSEKRRAVNGFYDLDESIDDDFKMNHRQSTSSAAHVLTTDNEHARDTNDGKTNIPNSNITTRPHTIEKKEFKFYDDMPTFLNGRIVKLNNMNNTRYVPETDECETFSTDENDVGGDSESKLSGNMDVE